MDFIRQLCMVTYQWCIVKLVPLKSLYMVSGPKRTKKNIRLFFLQKFVYKNIHRWESYALKQAERLKSHARAKKVVHNFAWNPLCFGILGFLNPTQHGGAPHEKYSKYLILMLRPPQCLATFLMSFKNL